MNTYNNYSVEDFDSFNCLKISKSIYIVLLFVLRGYIVWLISVTNMRDRVGIIQWIYPETSLFFISLLSGTIGLFVLLLLSFRRPDAAKWVQSSWPYCRILMVVALLFDLLVSFIGYFYWQLLSPTWLVTQFVIVGCLILICFKSKRLNINLKEFPQIIPEDKHKRKTLLSKELEQLSKNNK